MSIADPLSFGAPLLAKPRSASQFGMGGTLRQKRTAVSVNSALTDVAAFSGLPAKYIVTGFRVFDASTTLAASLATLGLYAASGGGGSAVVAPSTMTALSSATKVLGMTIALPNTYQTSSTLYVRNVVANGSAATVTVQLEIIDLS